MKPTSPAMESNVEEALLRCTTQDGREITSAPFSTIADGRPVRIATNGRLILMVDSHEAAIAPSEHDNVVMPIIAKCSAKPTHHATREDLIAWAGHDYRRECPECDGGLKGSSECGECSGEGVIECDLGHEHDCPECDGTGKVGAPCEACGGHGAVFYKHAPISIPAFNAVLDAHLIGGLFDLLPGTSIGVSQHGEITAFRCPGWMLLVMRLAAPESESIRRLALISICEQEKEADHETDI